jgi:hypothetical protein
VSRFAFYLFPSRLFFHDIYRSSYPSKDQQGIAAIMEERVNGMISEDEWTDVVNYLYNSHDSAALNIALRSVAAGASSADADSASSGSERAAGNGSASRTVAGQRAQSPSVAARRPGSSGPSTPGRDSKEAELKRFGYLRSYPKQKKIVKQKLVLAFQDFVKCILDFQLKNHEKFLARFVGNFRQADSNLDGVINPEEFHRLFMDIRFEGKNQIPEDERDNAEETFSTLLNIVDPFNSNRITFSSAASCLSRLGGNVKKKT